MIKPLWIAASLTLLAMTAWVGPAQADDAKPEEKAVEAPAPNPARFAPDFCDFEVTFPEKPAIAQKCVPGGGCYEVNSYVMVYDLQTTVDVSVTCNPSTPAAYKQYNEGVMKAALSGMVDDRQLVSHNTDYDEKENTKSAAITGVGKTGRQEKIYSAQIWAGPNSIFTVQAELIGPEHPKADKSFSEILRSIKGKAGKQLPPKPKPTSIPQTNNQ